MVSTHGKSIPCHRAVLACACPYFASLLNSSSREVLQGEAIMDAIDYKILKGMVDFMYGKEVSSAHAGLFSSS